MGINSKMILALDVFYENDSAKSVGILLDLQDESPRKVIVEYLYNVKKYEPGQFYKRELPCLLKVIENTDLDEVELIMIDGYIFTDNDKGMGLGAHLWEFLDRKIPIIGIAKNLYIYNRDTVRALERGDSKKPLYISSIGIDIDTSVSLVKNMKGQFRIPTLLKKLDSLTKNKE